MLFVKHGDGYPWRIRRILEPITDHHTRRWVLTGIRDRPVAVPASASTGKPPRIIHRKYMQLRPQRVDIELLKQAKVVQDPEGPALGRYHQRIVLDRQIGYRNNR